MPIFWYWYYRVSFLLVFDSLTGFFLSYCMYDHGLAISYVGLSTLPPSNQLFRPPLQSKRKREKNHEINNVCRCDFIILPQRLKSRTSPLTCIFSYFGILCFSLLSNNGRGVIEWNGQNKFITWNVTCALHEFLREGKIYSTEEDKKRSKYLIFPNLLPLHLSYCCQ